MTKQMFLLMCLVDGAIQYNNVAEIEVVEGSTGEAEALAFYDNTLEEVGNIFDEVRIYRLELVHHSKKGNTDGPIY